MGAFESGRWRVRNRLAAFVGSAVVGSLIVLGDVGASGAASVPPSIIDLPNSANECEQLGYAHGYKIDDGVAGTYQVGPGSLTITTDPANGQLQSWTSSFGIDAVYMKGGSEGGQLYAYDPESFADSDLVTPNTGNSNSPAEISHITFCYDYELAVQKTATTSLKRTHRWTVNKTGDVSSLVLTPGQTYPVGYSVTLAATSVDSNWAVSGTIAITNPDPTYSASVASVTDTVSGGISAAVSCPPLPAVLGPGNSITCTYGPTALPDGAKRVNTAAATVSSGSKVNSGSGTANVDFATATIDQVDETVTVNDSLQGPLGTVNAADAPKTFTYTRNVSFAACGEYDVPNTAVATANDTGAQVQDGHNVHVSISCANGCTLTQGYWKTHSRQGPAPYDDNWATLGVPQENSPFFVSGQTWYQVFRTAPAGNAYYQLAHQYMAAKLNVNNGASTTAAVTAAIAGAESFFATANPNATLTRTQKAQLVAWAATLASYNEGSTGPGHCSE